MKFTKTDKYDKAFVQENLMGPNSLKMLEELLKNSNLEKGSKVLDLGCGRGLTSIFLAKEYGAQVYATDLWIGASENYERFKKLGLEDQIVPIHADATDLPYADNFFDAIVSVDSYYFFARNDEYMDLKLAPLVKSGGLIALAFPGLKEPFKNGKIPDEMLISWTPEALETFCSFDWWRKNLEKSKKIEIISFEEMSCYEEAWNDWLSCENPYAVGDRASMNAGAGKYMNLISVIAKRI